MSGDWQPTACILCECNCGIVVQTEGRHLAKIRGDKDHPASQGYTCNKALRLDHYQNTPSRLTSPLRRRADGSYEEIDWDTAIAEIAAGFQRVAEDHGGDKIFYYGGGGQGNHLGGGYSSAFLRPLGSRYRSNALAQEKTGEAWVDAHFYGGHTRGEFEHAEVSVFVGKNPWMSQSFPRARTVLNDIAKDPGRSMIVIDPVVTDTAKMADFHLRVKPGADAWCLTALAAVLVQENLCDETFLADHVLGPTPSARSCATFRSTTTPSAAGRRRTAARRGAADRGGRQRGGVRGPRRAAGPEQHAVLLPGQAVVDLHRELRQEGRPAPALDAGPAVQPQRGRGQDPVTGAPIVGGLVPSNVVPQEILTDHPDRFRAMIVESSNPAHSIADSRACREAFESLELLVVIDVAMTETARLAHYVLPAASQFEKPEATFFNLEFPHNTFHLRHPLFETAAGHAGRTGDLGPPGPRARRRRRRRPAAAARGGGAGRDAYTAAFFSELAGNPALGKVLPYVLYETLGPTLPEHLKALLHCGVWRRRPR